MPATSAIAAATDPNVNALVSGETWATNRLTFSFPGSSVYYGSPYGGGEHQNQFAPFLSAQQAAARSALQLYASVANLSFSEIAETVSQHADIRFARSGATGTAWAYFPSEDAAGGDVWVGRSKTYDAPRKGNYAFLTLVHEIGHALGLDHAHGGNAMPLSRDSIEYTVMSYRPYVGASLSRGYTNETWGYAQSLMMYDIAAIQHMYGANYATNSTSTHYTWTPTGQSYVNGVLQASAGGNRIFQTVWDGGGTDTYDFTKFTTGVKVDLKPGAWTITSQTQRAKLTWDGSKLAAGNIANALLYGGSLQSIIENARGGSGNDVLKGNAARNSLQGNAGNDQLYGDNGNDALSGGAGNDMLGGQSGADVLLGGSGADSFRFWATSDSTAAACDTIKDFKRGQDHIDLRGIDANTKAAGDQAFTFIGKAAFSGKAGQLKFASGVLSGDVNGDKIADLVVKVAGLSALAKSDFYL